MSTIRYSDGRTVECDTIDEAVAILESECEVVEDCGDRWLAWASEEDAENDYGQNAVAEIVTR